MQYGVMGIAIVFSMAGAGVVVGGILAGSVDPPDADLWKALRWSAVSFACVIAPALVAWLTWRRLTRYMPLVAAGGEAAAAQRRRPVYPSRVPRPAARHRRAL